MVEALLGSVEEVLRGGLEIKEVSCVGLLLLLLLLVHIL
jgi:hypothetical protein